MIAELAEANGITVRELRSPSRKARHVMARDAVIRELYDKTDLTLTEIGRLVCRDHSTVCHSLDKTGRVR